MLREIRLKNLLSFKDAKLELIPLNVVIGANATEKSNLLEAIDLLRSGQSNWRQR
jgi:AAA15 family ATPase/GTPase